MKDKMADISSTVVSSQTVSAHPAESSEQVEDADVIVPVSQPDSESVDVTENPPIDGEFTDKMLKDIDVHDFCFILETMYNYTADHREEAKRKERENAAAAAELEIDKRKQAYDDYLAEVERDEIENATNAAEAQRKETEKQIAAEKAARQRMEQELLTQRIRDLQQITDAEKKRAATAETMKSAAESKLQQAWGWYMNKDSMAAQLDAEKKNAKAEKQFEKDFEKLKDRKGRNWRTAENLSVDDEAVRRDRPLRRVALAREEKQAADKWAEETAKNTADLARKIDELLTLK